MKQKTLINTEMDTVDKLNHLITIVTNIPNDQFDMQTWHEKTGCGTIGCALGWACCDSVFNKMGLRLSEIKPVRQIIIYVPSYEEKYDYEGAEEFFGITEDEAGYLFNQFSYDEPWAITKEHVITRIKEIRDKYKNT